MVSNAEESCRNCLTIALQRTRGFRFSFILDALGPAPLSAGVMRVRKVLAGAAVVAVVGIVASLLWSAVPIRCPPGLTIVSTEPAGIMDDMDREMWYVTLNLTNSENLVPSRANELYVRGGAGCIEARVAGHWSRVDGMLSTCALMPGSSCESSFLVPGGTDSCRVCLQFTGAHLIKGRLAWLAEHLPTTIRFRLSYKVWRWVGFTHYGPNSDWRETTIEVPVRRPSPRQGGSSSAALNERSRVGAGRASLFAVWRFRLGATHRECSAGLA